MPASRFFAMLKEAKKLSNIERQHQCDIQAISITNSKYYERVRESYSNFDARKIKHNTIDVSHDHVAAKHAMLAFFGSRRAH